MVNVVYCEYKYIVDAKETKWQVESAWEHFEKCWQNWVQWLDCAAYF